MKIPQREQAIAWLRGSGKMILHFVVFVLALGVGAQVLRHFDEIVAKVADRGVIAWWVQVFVVVVAAWGVIAVVIGFERARDKVPLWLFALLLFALGCQVATDWKGQRTEAAGRYSFLGVGTASLWRMDTTTGAVDVCGFEKDTGFSCRRLDAGTR